jgi:ribose-phosphate pyrophosphokinase
MIKVNGVVVGNKTFPNNERICNTISDSDKFTMDMFYETDIDIFTLSIYKKYLDDKFPNTEKILNMMYIPYSRMDREIDGFVFTLKYFSQVINDLYFDEVNVIDPHSSVSKALINRCNEYNIINNIYYLFMQNKIDYVFYPDAGAMKRYSEMLKLPNNTRYFFGNKKRNLQTGEIVKFELVDAPDLKDKTVLIIDDLCSKGGTFLASAKEMKSNEASKVYLYVTHCEHSIYDGELLYSDLIDKVYTTDSLLQDFSNDKIKKL